MYTKSITLLSESGKSVHVLLDTIHDVVSVMSFDAGRVESLGKNINVKFSSIT